ncbi:hypothetical protein LguiA_036145 [Lonicera macranthoides]
MDFYVNTMKLKPEVIAARPKLLSSHSQQSFLHRDGARGGSGYKNSSSMEEIQRSQRQIED